MSGKLTQFMNQKGFHPGSNANRKKVFIAQQKEIESKKRAAERQAELDKERSMMKSRKMLGQDSELDFMYKAPPGYENNKEKPAESQNNAIPAMSIPQYTTESMEDKKPIHKATTAKELEERFPHLKGAPKEAGYANNIAVNVKPLGLEVRNVRCARCGNWGHTSGDRECPMKDFNPRDDFHKNYEDPMAGMQNSFKSSSLVLKSALQSDQFGKNVNKSSTTILEAEEEEEEDLEAAFLNSLTKKQKKMLLKRLEKEERKQMKRDKKEKKRKRSESSSSSSSDSDDEDDKRDRKRQKTEDNTHKDRSSNVDQKDQSAAINERRDDRGERRDRDERRDEQRERKDRDYDRDRRDNDHRRDSDRDRDHRRDSERERDHRSDRRHSDNNRSRRSRSRSRDRR